MSSNLPDSLTTPSTKKINDQWRKRAHRNLSQAESLLLQILDVRTRGSTHHKVGIPTRLSELRTARGQLEQELSQEEAKRALPAQWLDQWGELLFRLDKQIDKIESLVGSAKEEDAIKKERDRVTGNVEPASRKDPLATVPQRQKVGLAKDLDQRSVSSDPTGRKSNRKIGPVTDERSSQLFSFGEHTSTSAKRSSNRHSAMRPVRANNAPLPDPTDEQLQAFQQEHNIQSRVLADQDESLDQLSQVLKRQQHIGLQMNDELDSHHQLLDNLNEGVGYTERHLHSANARVNRILERMKGQGSWFLIMILIVILILILLLLRLIT